MANDTPNTLSDYFDVVRRRWIFLATIFPAAMLIAFYLAFTLPPVYRSSATLVLEPSSIPEDWIRSTVTSYANEQLELVQRRVLTNQNLTDLVGEFDPYPDQGALTDQAKARLVRQNIQTERVDPFTLEPLAASNALSVHYHNQNPDRAVEVARRVADMFLSNTRESRVEAATENYRFLQNQAEQARRDIEHLELQLAEFKEEYGDALPEAQARNQLALERLERELDSVRAQLPPANERRSSLEIQLSQISPTLFDPDGGWRAELLSLQAELADARQRYTEDHPDVRRLQRSVEELVARVEPASGVHESPDNPEYIQVRNRLDSAEQELANLEDRANRTAAQIDAYEQRLRIAPGVEREYSQLTREYEFALDRLRGIENDLGEAALGREMESEARGDRLTLVRAPQRPDNPYSPNRLGIVLLGVVLGGALAVGVAAFTEIADPKIRSARDLGTITSIKPLAAIPVTKFKRETLRRAFKWVLEAVSKKDANPSDASGKRRGRDKQEDSETSTSLPSPDLPRSEIRYDIDQCRKNKVLISEAESSHPASSAAYRVLRTRFLQRAESNNWTSIGISSPGQGDGKSTTALNLALSIARAGNHNVFLIDLDLRRPRLWSYLGATPDREITDYLRGKASPDEVLFSIGVPNLTLAGATAGTGEASELLASPRVLELLSYIHDKASNAVILVDLPPLLSTDDALIMAADVDACLLVVSERRSRRDGTAKALELLEDFNLAGIVMNRSRTMVSGYYAAY